MDDKQLPIDPDDIQEGEVVDLSEPEVPSDATELASVTGLINNLVSQIDSLKNEVGKLKEMVDSFFENDSTYRAHDKDVKEASKIRSQTRKQIQKQPQVADLLNRIQNAKSLMKEKGQSLSDYLQEYAKSTGSTQFETADGQVHQIVYVAKLVNKTNIH
jgi:hypothetical protein